MDYKIKLLIMWQSVTVIGRDSLKMSWQNKKHQQ